MSTARLTRASFVFLIAASCGLAAACRSDEPDVQQALQVTDVVTGWFDSGIVDGQNKIVPTISFRVKNAASKPITYVTLNTVFRLINDSEELGSAMLKGISGEGLAAGATTKPFVARSRLGYTSQEPRTQMLQHSQFRDAQVEVFARHGSRGWLKLGEYKIQRQLLVR